jgi:Ran GTPase-activating protein (RanGAP) involved in mRNA processing and transport
MELTQSSATRDDTKGDAEGTRVADEEDVAAGVAGVARVRERTKASSRSHAAVSTCDKAGKEAAEHHDEKGRDEEEDDEDEDDEDACAHASRTCCRRVENERHCNRWRADTSSKS